MGTISSKELDSKFKYEVAAQPGGENVKKCFACGACSGRCLAKEVAEQFDPRKIIRMVLFGMKEEVLSTPAIWTCLMCHNCSFHCPQDVNFADVIGALRSLALKEGYVNPSFFRKLAFQALLPSHRRLELATRPVSAYQLFGLPSLVRRSRVLKVLPERLGSLEPMLPKVPVLPLSSRLKKISSPKGQIKYKVGFFLNCADDLVFVSSGLATVFVLNENSCEVVTPKNCQCCGMPFFAYGEVERAKRLARRNIDLFRATNVEVIITDCATCGSFLKGYGDLLKSDPDYAEPARAFSQKIQDISEFLLQTIKLKEHFGELKGKVTYHEPCHLAWGQNISEQPLQLLKLIPGLEFVAMKEANTCCGGAGSYNLTHYNTSMGILDRKMTNIEATRANIIATGCPGCQIQLKLGVKRHALNARVVHPIELLGQAYRNL